MKTYQYSKLTPPERQTLCQRQGIDFAAITPLLTAVYEAIKKEGDQALRMYTQKFDGVYLENFLTSAAEFQTAQTKISAEFKSALATALTNIQTFHQTQVSPKSNKIETSPGVFCWREDRPIKRVGLYIPGGTAPLFSTLLMTVIPAQIAGCEEIIIATPPQSDGSIVAEILYTAQVLGIKKVYKAGGAQAIFALATGTESIPQVDKIFGPGNQYVTAAKMMVSNTVAIDMPAGPSEVLVIADESSSAEFVASDLLSQAEHGADSQAVLVCTNREKSAEILQEISTQLQKLPRKNIAEKALENSFIVVTENLEQAFDFSNLYAPEHLILALADSDKWLEKISSAGSVFCGPLSCESFGDYASGTNHVLPTSGFARSFSGVSLDSFIKKITFQEITPQGCRTLGPVVEILAEKEDLQAHKNAITVRLKTLRN